MGEEDATVTEAAETVTNGVVSPDKAVKDVVEKKEKNEEVDEMAVDGKDNENGKNKEAEKEDAGVSEKAKQEEKEEVKDNKEEEDDKKEPKSDAMEVDNDKEVSSEEIENKDADTKKEEENKEEEKEAAVPEEKGSKKRSHKKGGGVKSNAKTKTPAKKKVTEKKVPEKKKEPTTPVAPTIDRPVRERKSVERLVAVIEQDTAKEFHIGKGRGTALKDIPNDLEMRERHVKSLILQDIDAILRTMGSSLKNISSMPLPDTEFLQNHTNVLIHDELCYNRDELKMEHENLFSSLTEEQQSVYGKVILFLLCCQNGSLVAAFCCQNKIV